MGLLEVNGLSLPLLAELSYPSQLGRSLKNNLGSFDKESLLLDALSAAEWLDMNPLLGEVAIDYRIKSEESIRTKYERYYPDRPVLKVFNDILGFRSCCDDYTEVLSLVSPRLKVVDKPVMTATEVFISITMPTTSTIRLSCSLTRSMTASSTTGCTITFIRKTIQTPSAVS